MLQLITLTNGSSLLISFTAPLKPLVRLLVRVQNDILCAIGSDKYVLLLLDLSAAFETVDHTILLSRLFHRFGVKGH